MNQEIKRINKTLLISWVSIVVILLSAYSVEVVKQERTLGYLLQFAVTMLIPIAISAIVYFKKPDWKFFGYLVVVGYSVMYAFVMFTGATQMVFSYILPLLCFLVLYHSQELILTTFGFTIVINVASLVYQLGQDSITISNSKDVEIRFAVILVSFAGGYASSKLYGSIHHANDLFTKELAVKNQEIQNMAIQTISTIANTIDAKDQYTRGHSKRVAEYSVAIARELGMEEDEITKLKSIALLHDIGKIGVPDSVLNKPGKLTDDEYDLMKQHTVSGAEILKDIGMLPGIDIGAKYHHERYDGKGYPEKLAGEDIPEIARIIAVADAFDAMTSNRVYRSHLDMDRVMGELVRCKGTQFDPKMDDALIRLLEEGRLQTISGDEEEEETLTDVSKIWTRVMEKDEEKYKDQSFLDELTGLYSRSHGENLIREAVEHKEGVLFIVDVDHFRRINEEAGYLLGDIFLRTVAVSLGTLGAGAITSRYGGDEFVAFVPGVTLKEQASTLAEHLIAEVERQNQQLDAEVPLTISIGICICNGRSNVYQGKYLDADRALYLSKRQGGNCYTFYEQMLQEKTQNSKENVDLVKLRDTIKHPEKYDTYISESPEFHRAYDMLTQLLSESEWPLQLILFTAKPNEGMNVSLDTHNKVMEYLEKAIARNIKGRDYTFRYSSTQRMILLTDSHGGGAKAVSSNIMKEFYKLYDKKEINIAYASIDIA